MATPQAHMQCGNNSQLQPVIVMTTPPQPEVNFSLQQKKLIQNRVGNLAVFEIVLGIITIVIGVINITSVHSFYSSYGIHYYYRPRMLYGEGVWAGLVMVIIGIIGIRTAKSNASESMIKCYKVFSILGAIFSVASTTLSTMTSVTIFNSYILRQETTLKIFYPLVAVCCLILLILSVLSVYFSCAMNSTSCCQLSPTENNDQQAIYIQQPGMVGQQHPVILHQKVHQFGMVQKPIPSPNMVQELTPQQQPQPQTPTVVQYTILPHQQITQQPTIPPQGLVQQPVVFQQPAMVQQTGMIYPQLGHVMQAQQSMAPALPPQLIASAPGQSAPELEQEEHEAIKHEACAFTNPAQSYE